MMMMMMMMMMKMTTIIIIIVVSFLVVSFFSLIWSLIAAVVKQIGRNSVGSWHTLLILLF